MSRYGDYYKARDVITGIVRSDLIGPVFEDEVINEPPTSYYIMGKLYPRTDEGISEDDNTTSADVESAEDAVLSSTNVKEPRSMGITFTVKEGVKSVNIKIDYAFYTPYSLSETEKSGINIEHYREWIDGKNDKEKDRLQFWRRTGLSKEFVADLTGSESFEIENDVFLKVFVHMITAENEKVVTAVITNERSVKGEDKKSVAQNTILQPTITVYSADKYPIFTEVQRQVALTDNEELQNLEMLYSRYLCYAQGHGCSVIWDIDNDEPEYIRSEFMPMFDLHQMKAMELKGVQAFNMHYLFNADRGEIVNDLLSFVDSYNEWIEKQREKAKSVSFKDYAQSVNENLKACSDISERIKNSISILGEGTADDNMAWKAFRYANEAMYMQRCRTIIKENEAKGDNADIDPNSINWYPFQLAFILLEITSFVRPDSKDRTIVDLLWFPTGGGKTEAYLGIAAFEIFYRRLTNPKNCNGLTVIMRYTLRLLTIQQFERASILICACEMLRKKYSIPGDEISIGLWVGNNYTPGDIDKADDFLFKMENSGVKSNDDVDPCQVKVCPWCGSRLHYKNYKVNTVSRRLEIKCSNERCDYHGIPLPVRLIDEEIYKYRPAFLVATVDKFAQLAIQEKTAALFSLDNDSLPPELIIQDELHLISGPLGTMTGIYEAAITKICERKGSPAKVIASTATIRNASNQILSLYGRPYNQFPPQGITADDSFFAVKSSAEERPVRQYCGIMGVGTTFTTTLIRLYASWLYASRYLKDLGYDEKVIDNYWTLTGYFNSIRELGATQTQIVDDIQSRYKFLKDSKFKMKYPDFSGDEFYENSIELTSRMSNDELSEIIQDKLKVSYEENGNNDVYDFVLASNMISVGVDVGRLGTMAVAGQSKTNAEYIQATSRVGRSNPGLVFTIFNAVRSRDRSHYEQFSKYHSALYRYVEATSLTPFSDRARDRGLQALFVILCRYYCPELLGDSAAANFTPNLEGVKEVEKIIYSYVNKVDSREADQVLAEIKDIERQWYEAAQSTQSDLWYRNKKKPSLLRPDIDEYSRFRIMNSMRSVEAESGIFLIGEKNEIR